MEKLLGYLIIVSTFFIIKFIQGSSFFDCQSKNETLELTFLEPVFVYFNPTTICSLNFIINGTNSQQQNNSRLTWISMGRFYSESSITDLSVIISKENNLFFGNGVNASYGKLYLRGFALFDEWNDNDCPMESISRKNPFKFTNENQILFINSSYFENNTRKNECQWFFEGPKGYGFKIVLTHLELIPRTKLIVKNSTGYNILGKFLEISQAYYNEDNHLNIFLSKSSLNLTVLMEMSGYITIVKKKPTLNDCTFHNVSWSYFWTSEYDSYKNNVKCFYNLTVLPNTQILMELFEFDTEINIDTLSYVDKYGIKTFLKNGDVVVFEGYRNQTNKHASIEFKSDGNVAGGTIKLRFTPKKCTCGNPIIIDGYDFHSLCANMKCNYTIEFNSTIDYSEKFVFIDLYIPGDIYMDTYKIISNNKIILEAISRKTNDFVVTAIINPNDLNIFEVITSTFPYDRRMILLQFNIYDKPEVRLSHILSEENPYFAIDLNIFLNYSEGIIAQCNELMKITTPSHLKNANIQIYSWYTNAIFNNVFFFINETLNFQNQISHNCFDKSEGYSCDTGRNEVITYIKKTNVQPLLLFQLSKEYRKGCLFEQNVFYLYDGSHSFLSQTITAISNKFKNCNVFLIQDFVDYNDYTNYTNIYISKLWTTAKKENVKIFIGSEETRLILEFNSNTASKWQNIRLFGKFYIIEIPQNSSIKIDIHKIVTPFLDNTLLFPSYSSVVTTPWNGESYLNLPMLPDMYTNVCFMKMSITEKQTIEFMVYQFDVSKYWNFSFFANNVLQNLSHIGDKITLSNINVRICYNPFNAPFNFDGNGYTPNIPLNDYSGATLHLNVKSID